MHRPKPVTTFLTTLAFTFAGGAMLLALAPTSALAHKHPSPSGRCNVNINVAPRARSPPANRSSCSGGCAAAGAPRPSTAQPARR